MQSDKNILIPHSFSTYLDLLRILAAIFVFIFHLKSRNLGHSSILNFIPNISHFAVILFFILSGYLIAASVDSKKELGLKEYVLDRLSRVYSVATPALILCLGFALIFSKNAISTELLTILSNFLFLGQSWLLEINPFWNTPYWSLCYEVMYYILFGCFIFFKNWKRWLLIVIFSAVAGIKILLLMPCWLLGVAIYHVRSCIKLNIFMAVLLAFLLPIACSVIMFYFRIHHQTNKLSAYLLSDYYGQAAFSGKFITDFVMAVLFAIHLYAMRYLMTNYHWGSRSTKLIKGGAAMSFTLYLIHQPLVRFVDNVVEVPRDNLTFMACLIGIPLTCYAISLLTEAKRPKFKAWLNETLFIK